MQLNQQLGVQPVPAMRQPEQPVQGQNPLAVHDQAVHDQHDARPKRGAKDKTRARN